MKIIVGLVLWISGVRLTPHFLLMMLSSNRALIGKDLDRWGQIMFGKKPDPELGPVIGATVPTLIAEEANRPSTRKNSRDTGTRSSGL